MPLSDATREAAERLVKRYPVARSALLPLLHLVQSDEGYVSEEGIAFCAQALQLTKAEVGAVATFYTMFKREPVGDWLLSVCTNPTCKIAGGQRIYDAYVDDLGGHREPDAGVSVEHVECLGICDAAPVVQVNYEMYGPLTFEEGTDLLAKCKSGSPPPSNWSGEVPATFKEVERELSGANDGVDEFLIEAARLQATSEVPPAYRTGETDIPVTHPGGDPAGHGGTAFRATAQLDGSSPAERQGLPPSTGGSEASLVSEAGRWGVEEDEEQVATDVVDETAGEAQELAEHVSEGAPEKTPASQDQPDVDTEGGATAAEAESDQPAEGSEDAEEDR